jgi:hypothetical protein
LGPFLGLDLKAGVDQSLDDDFRGGLRIRDRHRKVVAVEQVDQHVLRVTSLVPCASNRGALILYIWAINVCCCSGCSALTPPIALVMFRTGRLGSSLRSERSITGAEPAVRRSQPPWPPVLRACGSLIAAASGSGQRGMRCRGISQRSWLHRLRRSSNAIEPDRLFAVTEYALVERRAARCD